MSTTNIPALITGLLSKKDGEGAKKELSKGREEKELLAKLDRWYSEAKNARQKFERDWYTNMAFYFGRQWITWQTGLNGNYSRMHEPPAPAWRVRLVSNKIRPIVRKEISKITKEKPTTFVIPASMDNDDRMAAEAAEHTNEHIWNVIKMKKIIRRAVFWEVLCGTSFIKDWYSPNEKDEEGIPGRIKAEPVSPFHIFVPNMDEEEIENQPWVIHALAKDPKWVEEIFGVKLEADTNSSAGLIEQKFMTAVGAGDSPKKYVLIKEVWIKPCKDYPEGAVVHWAKDKILKITEKWPYQYADYPFSKLDHIPTGRFYAESTIKDLIPLQKEYNRTRSQIIESKNRMSKPQLLAGKGTINPRKVTSEPGLVIEYTLGHTPPTPLQLQNLPSYVLQELDRNQQDMNDIASQHEVTQGQTPPGVEAATAIAYLQEQDDSVLAPTLESLEEAVEKLGRHFISHVQQFWQQERTIRVVGANRIAQSLAISSASVQGVIDLRVESGSSAPRSRAAKQAFIMELGKNGYIPPEKVLQYLEMTESARMYEEMQIDARQAQRENYLMMQGQPLEANSWDDHVIHIAEHNNFRKTQEFENLDDQIKIIFEQHVIAHTQVAGQMSGQMLPPGAIPNPQMLQALQGGGPGGPPIPGQPQ